MRFFFTILAQGKHRKLLKIKKACINILQIWSVTFLEMNSIGSPSPSLTIISPLDPSIPQPSTAKTTLWLRSVTTKPPPFTTMGRLLIISIVGVPEQKILLTTGMLLSISLDAAHKAEGEISCLDLNPCFCLPTLPLASSGASRRVLILEQKTIVSNKIVSQAEKQWGKSSRLVWFRVSILC